MATNPDTILAESGLFNALYGEAAAAVTATGEATALNTEAAGTTAEAAQYGTAADISQQNAQLATVSGQLQQYQNTRTLMNTLGTQQADISGAGFADTGTAVNLARSSLQQGLLQNQVLGVNAQVEAGGYLEQAAASTAEQQAAQTTAATETTQAGTAASLSALDTAQQTSTANLLQSIPGVSLTNTGPNGLPEVDTSDSNELGGQMVSAAHPYVI